MAENHSFIARLNIVFSVVALYASPSVRADDSSMEAVEPQATATSVKKEEPQATTPGHKEDAGTDARQVPETQTQQEKTQVQQKNSVNVTGAATHGWVFQARTGLGGGRVAGEKNLSSDRLAVGLYGGRSFPDLNLSLPIFSIKSTTAGVAYHSFTAVDSVEDLSWAVQSLGAQARILMSPFPWEKVDLAVQGGLALQRMVSQTSKSRSESNRYGFGLLTGGYARMQATPGVYALAGADLVLGTASWVGVVIGLESQF